MCDQDGPFCYLFSLMDWIHDATEDLSSSLPGRLIVVLSLPVWLTLPALLLPVLVPLGCLRWIFLGDRK